LPIFTESEEQTSSSSSKMIDESKQGIAVFTLFVLGGLLLLNGSGKKSGKKEISKKATFGAGTSIMNQNVSLPNYECSL
jgi:hypothetical protein